jgi:hypothetical protein
LIIWLINPKKGAQKGAEKVLRTLGKPCRNLSTERDSEDPALMFQRLVDDLSELARPWHEQEYPETLPKLLDDLSELLMA